MSSSFPERPDIDCRDGRPLRRRLGWPWSAIAWLLDVDTIEELLLPNAPDAPDLPDLPDLRDAADEPPVESGNRQ
ncbi:MAG: hypothetical protein EOP37_22970 [Rubrivivax sp.]|nr:MAG: hypothetical protein EOP37_22970 [Rubrivivax sp.]